MRLRRPSLLALGLLALGLAVCVSAGAWQYGKGVYKQERELRWASAREAGPVPLSQVAGGDAGGVDRVTAHGQFQPQRYLLDNQVRSGRAGVEAFAPLRVDDGTVVLVALGWLPYADARRTPPALPALPGGTVLLSGLLTPPPAHGLRFGRDWAQVPGYPKLMPYFALEDIAADLGQAPIARVLRLDAEPGSAFRREWQAVDSMPPARHFGYALQWWSLAAAIVIVFVVVHRRRPDPRSTTP
jgi:surfeit locus 1 family protein